MPVLDAVACGGYLMSRNLSVKEKIARSLARLLFDLADRISPDTVWELSTEIAMDAGFGYCDDCQGPEPDESRC